MTKKIRMKQTCNKCWSYGNLFGIGVCWLGFRMTFSTERLMDGKFPKAPAELCPKPMTKKEFEIAYKEKYPELDIIQVFKMIQEHKNDVLDD